MNYNIPLAASSMRIFICQINHQVDYDAANEIFESIESSAREGLGFARSPYVLSIAMVTSAGFLSFPLCFHLETVEAFNEYLVTTEQESAENLETILEVGSWAWNWMEPILGQLSFFLLCLQFSRSQMEKIGSKPFTVFLKASRAKKLAAKYPQYDRDAVIGYAMLRGLKRG